MKNYKKFLTAAFLFLFAVSLDLNANREAREDHSDSNNDDYDLYDRNRDGMDFNQYDFPENAEDGRPDEASGANSIKLLR